MTWRCKKLTIWGRTISSLRIVKCMCFFFLLHSCKQWCQCQLGREPTNAMLAFMRSLIVLAFSQGTEKRKYVCYHHYKQGEWWEQDQADYSQVTPQTCLTHLKGCRYIISNCSWMTKIVITSNYLICSFLLKVLPSRFPLTSIYLRFFTTSSLHCHPSPVA